MDRSLYSADGRWLWDGRAWQPVQTSPAASPQLGSPPPDPTLSADGRWRWDGSAWRERAGSPSWERPYSSNETRTAWATSLLGAALCATVLFTLATLLEIGVASTALSQGRQPTDGENLTRGISIFISALLYELALLGCVIAVPIWAHRAYRNLPALGASGLRYSPRWAAGSWFVPIVNFFLPCLVVGEAWRASDPAERGNTRESRALQPFPRLILAWWLLFIFSGLVSNVTGRLVNGAQTLGQTVAVDWVLVASNLLDIVAATLAIVVIRTLNARQETRWRALQAGSSAEDRPQASSVLRG